jgi:AcrR family transcriptional regulator
MLKKMNDDSPVRCPRGPKPVRVTPSHILDAAQAVFARNGVDGSSIRAIAKEAKCDPSLLYYYFENKEAIFVAILERKFSRFMPDLENIASAHSAQRSDEAQRRRRNEHERTPLQEALWQTLKTFHKHLKDDAGFRGMIRGNLATNQSFSENEMVKYVTRIIQIISEYFRGGIESGELRGDINLNTTTFFFSRVCLEILDIFPVLGPGLLAMPLEEAVDLAERQWFRLFWAGIKNDMLQVADKQTLSP